MRDLEVPLETIRDLLRTDDPAEQRRILREHRARIEARTFRLQRVLPHSQEVVFDAWTQAEALSGWFAPTDEYTTIIHALDVRPGGEYRIEMRHVSGAASVVVGRYVEVRRPGRLVFTWRWQESARTRS
jgi:uncharacterized protein YndB with AHSA1/START domain